MLDENYYNSLITKYSNYSGRNKISDISVNLILDNYINKSICVCFPNNYMLDDIVNQLYENLSKRVFKNFAEIVDYSVGDRLQRENDKKKRIYVITKIIGNKYYLTIEKNPVEITVSFERLKQSYTLIRKSTRNTTLQKYRNYFKDNNSYGFTPQFFSKQIVLIAGQTIWNKLRNKSCIPTTYLPNTREDEQTPRKSIEVEGDIAYVTPRYIVCYEEILKKNVSVDTIVVCDTDLDSLAKIIYDKQTYKFNLIILSSRFIPSQNGLTTWHWQQEEINYLEGKIERHIDISQVHDYNHNLKDLIQRFDDCVKYVSSLDPPIKLNSYGYFFRMALNALQNEQFEYILMRLNNNKELERNDGGYEDFGEINPKDALRALIEYLKEYNPKFEALNECIAHTKGDAIFIVDRNNVDCFENTRYCRFETQKEFKKLLKIDYNEANEVVFHSFNGLKDFEFIYNIKNNVKLVLYQEEEYLYKRQLQIHEEKLEHEFTSEDRYVLCGIKYKINKANEVKISPTLEQIIERIEQRSKIEYEIYKEESDSLFDDIEEETTYQIETSNNIVVELQSNETVFDNNGNLIKSYRLKKGDKVRFYPKERLADGLLQIASETEPEIFGKINEHATIWLECLKQMEKQYANRDKLYYELKENGLKVLQTTIDAYFRGQRKFPMFNSDLRAILQLSGNELLYEEIKKSKRLYNSTMIALGRGIKQELKQFLKEKKIGDILQKKGFSKETLQKFIDECMPLLTITKIEEVKNEQQ